MDRVVGMPGSRCDTAIGFGDCEVLEVADGSPDVGGGIDPDGGHRNHDHSKRVVIEYFFAWVGNIVLLCFKAFGVRLERSNDDFCCRRMGHYGGVCGKAGEDGADQGVLVLSSAVVHPRRETRLRPAVASSFDAS